MKRHPQTLKRALARGFSLVELMVALTVGFIVVLAITGAVLVTGRQLKVIGSNSASQSNALIALSAINASGRSAGAGLYANGALICPTLNAWFNGATRSDGAVLIPARVTDGGGNTASDTVVFTYASTAGALSAMPVVDTMATATSSIRVSNAGTLAANDLALLGAPGSSQPCTLFQVTSAPTPELVAGVCGANATSCKTLPRATDASTGYNPPAGSPAFTNWPRFGFDSNVTAIPPIYGPAVVARIGSSFRQDAYAIQCNTLVQYNAFTGPLPANACTAFAFDAGVNAMVADVVQMHAQYGISNIATSDEVTSWVNASSPWDAPTAANVGRIKAVRMVVVTRSQEPEPSNVTAASCTNGAAVINVGPCSFDDAAAPVIDLSATTVPTGKTWRNYRYRVHKAVIPLRNVIWSS